MLCLDVSPLIAMEDEKTGLSKNDGIVLDCLEPLTKSKKKVLMHPIINTYVMIQYNSYTTLFMIILLLKLLHAILISGLTVMELPNQNDTDTDKDTIDEVGKQKIGVWYILAMFFTLILLFVEIVELVAIKLKYFYSLRNWIQSLHCIFIIVYQIVILVLPDDYDSYVNPLGALVVFIAWLDLSVSLKSLMFSKWSNLGLYISMLIEVKSKRMKYSKLLFLLLLRLLKKSA